MVEENNLYSSWVMIVLKYICHVPIHVLLIQHQLNFILCVLLSNVLVNQFSA